VKGVVVVIVLLLLAGGGWYAYNNVLSPDTGEDDLMVKDEDTAEDVDYSDDGDGEDEDPATEYQYTGVLKDVSGGTATGEANANFLDDSYVLYATFEGLPEPEGTDFYEGWVVRPDPFNFISTGVVEKVDDMYVNLYSSEDDLTDHFSYVLTIEPDDGDPAPADHILEGDMVAN
jgi:hypothetical protein